MQYNLPYLIGMTKDKAEEMLEEIGLSYQFVELKNHRHQYKEKRVVRQVIQSLDEGELLVVEYTGFPTLENEN